MKQSNSFIDYNVHLPKSRVSTVVVKSMYTGEILREEQPYTVDKVKAIDKSTRHRKYRKRSK